MEPGCAWAGRISLVKASDLELEVGAAGRVRMDGSRINKLG